VGFVGIVLLTFLIAGWLIYDHYSSRLEDKIAAIENIAIVPKRR